MRPVEFLERLGQLWRLADPHAARRKPVRLTERGADCLARSSSIFDDLRAGWVETLGADRLRALEGDLRAVTPAAAPHIDMPGC